MKRVNITTYSIGLLIRNQEFIRVLSPGKHWIRPFDQVEICDMTKPFAVTYNVDVLLKNEDFLRYVTVTDVLDNELAIEYKDGKINRVLPTGRYIQWNTVHEYRYDLYDVEALEVPATIPAAVLQRRDVIMKMRTWFVDTYEAAMLLVNGEFVRALKPGTYRFWKNTNEISVLKIDLRQKQLEIAGQELLTKDKAGIRISLYTQYRVVDAEAALLSNTDYERQLYILMQLALRQYVGTKSLDELLANKNAISDYAIAQVEAQAAELGVTINTVGVRDIILPGDMKTIMNQVLMAEKQAQANTIMRREETASTRSLLNTAKLMEDNEMLLKLKEMEYVEKIADKINTISVSGGGQVIDQLRELFIAKK